MPIGVPRVPYRTPKEGGWQWVDIWNCLVGLLPVIVNPPVTSYISAVCKFHSLATAHAVLQYRERIVFLGKAIDEETGNQLVATMLYLDSENKKDLNLYINCSGGDVSTHMTGQMTMCCCTDLLCCIQRMVTSCDHLQVVPCLALHDTMRHIKSDVVTVGFGGCMGMSGFLLAVGKKVCCSPSLVSGLAGFMPNMPWLAHNQNCNKF